MLRVSSGSDRSVSLSGVISFVKKFSNGEIAGSCSWNFLISSREISGASVRVPKGAMSSSARSNSSIQGVVAVLPKH